MKKNLFTAAYIVGWSFVGGAIVYGIDIYRQHRKANLDKSVAENKEFFESNMTNSDLENEEE